MFRRAFATLREDGFSALLLKIKFYLKNRLCGKRHTEEDSLHSFADVLFVNGCSLPHPARYRVTHQREQLFAYGVSNSEVFYTDLKEEHLKRYRIFIFYRCPYTEELGEFVKRAKASHKPVLYDVDDLVIDRKYTDGIPYLSTLSKVERKDYDDGVERMHKMLCLCDGAITTTETLAEELKHYVPEVFINRNTISDAMCRYSEDAVYRRDILPECDDELLSRSDRKRKKKILWRRKAEKGIVKIGYFSGSITHNDDVDLILPALQTVMERHENLHLYFAGKLDVPPALKKFEKRIHAFPMVGWEKLPERIASVDINIAPLSDTVFNAAKSENKWSEAAAVKVPTVASDVGAMKRMIRNGETGLLAKTTEEWIISLETLIERPEERKRIAENAYLEVHEHCRTISSGKGLFDYVTQKMTKNIAFVLPSLQISGGILVALKHAVFLKKAGYDVLLINDNVGEENVVKDGEELNVLSTRSNRFSGKLDAAVATLWTTVQWIGSYPKVGKTCYLVQGYETDFSPLGSENRPTANSTYCLENITYLTVSRWCEKWLKEKFGQEALSLHNGLERKMFPERKRNFGVGKIRILVEGNSDDAYKNVDESFLITNQLDPEKYEIWFLSYQGKPKPWYRVDKFLHRVPYEAVAEVYRQCDILVKSSILESFSYPPLEMMATGGYVVVRPNEGNAEYLLDGENCLLYDPQDPGTALSAIGRITSDESLRERLYCGGLRTAEERDWSNYEKEIVDRYKTRLK